MSSRNLGAVNTPDEPGNLAPRSVDLAPPGSEEWTVDLEPASFTVIEADLGGAATRPGR